MYELKKNLNKLLKTFFFVEDLCLYTAPVMLYITEHHFVQYVVEYRCLHLLRTNLLRNDK